MKILFFNLGSLESRLNDWGIEGFNSIFTQDVILWGPIPEKTFSYNNRSIPIINLSEQTSIHDIFRLLPENWLPDIVTCDTSVLNYVPDMYLCPVKTILFARDSWADTIFNRGLIEFFDFVIYGVIDRSLYKKFQAKILPLSNCAVTIPKTNQSVKIFENRDIDVISIANYNNSFYHDRYRTLYKLSDSNKSKIKIRYVLGIKRDEINKYYQRSKIVLDWAHTLSNRSFEAALNGCLLFSHESNYLTKEFWHPWDEFIPYNDKNVLELINHYLANPTEAKKVIDNASRRIKNVPISLGEFYWQQIELVYNTNINVKTRIERNGLMPLTDLYSRMATPFIYNYNYGTNYPLNWKDLYFERIDFALKSSSNAVSKITTLIEASRMAFLLQKYPLSEKYLSELEILIPQFGWINYLRGRIFFDQNKLEKSLHAIQRAIGDAILKPELFHKYFLPVIEEDNCCDARRITNLMWHSVYEDDNEFQVNSFFHLALELKGDIYRLTAENENAIKAYCDSISYIPISRCICKAAKLLIDLKDFEQLYEISVKGLDDSPYDSVLVLYQAYALMQLSQIKEAQSILADHREALKSFNNNRRLYLIQNLISILIIIKPLGKNIMLRIILRIINSLQRT
jgi:hypothetical protein